MPRTRHRASPGFRAGRDLAEPAVPGVSPYQRGFPRGIAASDYWYRSRRVKRNDELSGSIHPSSSERNLEGGSALEAGVLLTESEREDLSDRVFAVEVNSITLRVLNDRWQRERPP